jgi:hypothetical protein
MDVRSLRRFGPSLGIDDSESPVSAAISRNHVSTARIAMDSEIHSMKKTSKLAAAFAALSIVGVETASTLAEDVPATRGPLRTRWADDVQPGVSHSEYPRPTMQRADWVLLNGSWDYAVRPRDQEKPTEFDGRIHVPFPIESELSGVRRTVGEANRLWYRRTVDLPVRREVGRWLLHFGAVDWEATVWVNGAEVGSHRGGYTPFSCDVTAALRTEGPQEIVVAVWDPTDRGYQPRGKQVEKPQGIWYTAVTGIWQTVWLEPVPKTYLKSLHIVPKLDPDRITIRAETGGDPVPGAPVFTAKAYSGTQEIGVARSGNDGVIEFSLPGLRRWTPDSPTLYDLRVGLVLGDQSVDEVRSYFALRELAVRPDDAGVPRYFLNGAPIFLYGPLDQGWWPDGLYTAPNDEALLYDIEVTKQLGFNSIRKHVKLEPERWYWHCDRVGMLVWQDMPSGDRAAQWNPFGEFDGRGEIERTKESAENFDRELRELIDARRNHPSIVMWIPFNEAWGQFDTVRVTNWTKEYDPSRLVIGASGGNDYRVGDANDIHRYPGPARPPLEKARVAVLGEFGGLGLPLPGHTWQNEANWGYRSFETKEALAKAYFGLVDELRPLIAEGLAAAIYTQTTDVEVEVNGLLTYDRKVIKIDPDELAKAHARLYAPPPLVRIVVPTSESEGQTWRVTTSKPKDGWTALEFDDGSWTVSTGGLGTRGTPGAIVRTEWNGADIWLRRVVELDGMELVAPHFRIHHDDAVKIWVNGELALERGGYTSNYIYTPIAKWPKSSDGRYVIAVHCHQDRGGQYIDVGLADFVERPVPAE